MNKRVRIILGCLILGVSITLLIWSFKPVRHEVRTQPLDPGELQLPTPITFLAPLELVS